MVFTRFVTTCTSFRATLESLYNFAVEKVKIVCQIVCRIAKVEPSSTSAMAQLRQLNGLRVGCGLGISQFRNRRIVCHNAKCFCESCFMINYTDNRYNRFSPNIYMYTQTCTYTPSPSPSPNTYTYMYTQTCTYTPSPLPIPLPQHIHIHVHTYTPCTMCTPVTK